MQIIKNRIKDSQFREANTSRHPEFEPYMIRHTHGPEVYFKSTYNDDPLAKTLATKFPHLYYWPEKPEHKELKLTKDGYLVLPHSKFIMYTTDGSSFGIEHMMEKSL